MTIGAICSKHGVVHDARVSCPSCRAEGYAQGIEAAAKEADHFQAINTNHKCGSYIAAAIRALLDVAEGK